MGNAMEELLDQVEPLDVEEGEGTGSSDASAGAGNTTGADASNASGDASAGASGAGAEGSETGKASGAKEAAGEKAENKQDVSGSDAAAAAGDAVEGKDKEGKEENPDPKDQKISALEAEVLSYRQALRSMRRQHLATDSRISALEKTATSTDEDADPEELAAARQQQEIAQQARQRELSQYLENMRISDKYGDVDSVVTTRRVDDVLENLSAAYAKEQGIPFSQALAAVEEHVWTKLQNPYRYLYNYIKKVHPEYASSDGKAGAGTAGSGAASTSAGGGQEGQKSSTRERTPVTAPTSIHNLGGADDKTTSWTAAKIDALDEADLGKVPAEVYQKWLDGELK